MIYVLAEVTTVAYAVVAIGLLAAAYFLSTIKKPEAIRDSRPTTIALRGQWGSYVIGRGRPSVTFFHASHRSTTQEGKGGGKGLGGGAATKQTVYWEEGGHFLSIGPLSALYAIEESAKVIFQGPITPKDTPSGSTLTCTDGSIFRIYWGEKLQPIDPTMSKTDRVGFKSRYPYLAYVFWVRKRLGTAATWPNLEYDVEGLCVGSRLLQSSCVLPAQDGVADDYGMNGAHMNYQLTTGQSPWGSGLEPDDLDFGTLQNMGKILEAEHVPQHYTVLDGMTAGEVIAEILLDTGFVVSQQGDKLLFLPIRPPVDGEIIPLLDDRIMVAPFPEHEIVQGPPNNDRIVFLCKDHLQRNKEIDFPVDDDGTARNLGRKNTKRVGMNTILDAATGAKVADRRTLELLASAERLTLNVSRTFKRLIPGQAFIHPDFGKLRAASVQMESTTSQATVEAIHDQFSLALSGYAGNGGSNSGDDPIPEPDLAVRLLELPHEYVGEGLFLGVVRVRGSSVSGSATILMSVNGFEGSYKSIGRQGAWAAGGTLLEDLDVSRDTVIEEGPLVSALNADIENVLDLSGDEPAWRSGRQVCLIDDEAFYLRNLSAETGGYRLMGLIRARLGTLKAPHTAADAPLVYIFGSEEITPLTSNEWAKGSNVHIKSVPDTVSAEDVVAQLIEIKGLAFSPLPTDNLLPVDFTIGANTVFAWTYRVRVGTGEGAGEAAAGVPLLSDTQPEGPFLIQILQAGTLLEKRRTTVTATTWTYTSANRAADFGGVEPAEFVVKITNLKGSQGAYPRSWTIIERV